MVKSRREESAKEVFQHPRHGTAKGVVVTKQEFDD